MTQCLFFPVPPPWITGPRYRTAETKHHPASPWSTRWPKHHGANGNALPARVKKIANGFFPVALGGTLDMCWVQLLSPPQQFKPHNDLGVNRDVVTTPTPQG